jgi:hypothetical protein
MLKYRAFFDSGIFINKEIVFEMRVKKMHGVVLFLLHNTYTNQSTAKSKETSWTGASMAVSTINISTSAALGTLADAMLAAVEVRLQSSKTKHRNSSLKQAACRASFIALRGVLLTAKTNKTLRETQREER